MDDRPVPHSISAETAVLGAALSWPNALHEAAAVLSPEHFFRAAHQKIYARALALDRLGREVDALTVKDALSVAGELDEVGGPAYVYGLTDGVPKSANVPAYAALVREKARLREVIAAAGTLADEAYAEEPSAEVLDKGVRTLLALAPTDDTGAEEIGVLAKQHLARLDPDLPAPLGIGTGFRDLDDLLVGGLVPGDLALVAARPSVGKTSFALALARSAARHGWPTVVLSLEERKERLAEHVLAREAGVASAKMRSRMLNAGDRERLAGAVLALANVPLVIEDASRTLTQVAAWCHRLQQRPEGLGLVIVDYLQLMASGQRTRSGEEEISAISRGLTLLAKDIKLPIVALSQLSRAPEGRQDKRPQLSDLRGSGSLEQDAALVLLLFREELHKPSEENRGIAEAIVAKNRSGPTGVVRLYFNADYAWFADLAVAS